jgi:hypothetical protein
VTAAARPSQMSATRSTGTTQPGAANTTPIAATLPTESFRKYTPQRRR